MSVKIIQLLNINIVICIHKGKIENSVNNGTEITN